MELEQLNDLLKKHDLELVIGLETHVRLNTKTKLFCSCPNQETEQPNQHICSVCTGQMGVLPAINKEAIRKCQTEIAQLKQAFNQLKSKK